jgi:hypothetical protein
MIFKDKVKDLSDRLAHIKLRKEAITKELANLDIEEELLTQLIQLYSGQEYDSIEEEKRVTTGILNVGKVKSSPKYPYIRASVAEPRIYDLIKEGYTHRKDMLIELGKRNQPIGASSLTNTIQSLINKRLVERVEFGEYKAIDGRTK